MEGNSCKAEVFNFKKALNVNYTLECHDRTGHELLRTEDLILLDPYPPRVVFKHSVVLFTDILPIFELASPQNPQDVLKDAWLQWLLLEEGANNHSWLVRLSVKNVVHISQVVVLFPLNFGDLLDMGCKRSQPQPVEGRVLQDLLVFCGLRANNVAAVIHFIGLVRLSREGT